MSDYVLQAEQEMWAEVVKGERQRSRERSNDAGRRMLARYTGSCDWCGCRVRRGDPITWSRARRRLLCEGCSR